MVDHSPIRMPGITVAPAPIQEPLPTRTLPQRIANDPERVYKA